MFLVLKDTTDIYIILYGRLVISFIHASCVPLENCNVLKV